MATYEQIQLRRDSTLNWEATNPRLALGEAGIDMNLQRFKIGNGIDRWNELPFMDDTVYQDLDSHKKAIADKVQEIINQIATNKREAESNLNTKTNALQSQIDTNKQTAANALEQTRQNLQGQITSNKQNADSEISGLKSRMSGLETRQENYEEDLTAEFESTKSAIHDTLSDFEQTTDGLAVRMDVIAGQTTEDTEILDARVDADNQVHPNLGHNIRSIQQSIGTVKNEITADIENVEHKISAVHEASNERDDFLQEQADTLANLAATQAIRHESDVRAIKDDLSGVHGNISELQDKTQALQTQSDSLNDEVNHDREISNESDSHLQEQINALAEGSQTHSAAIHREIQERKKSDTGLHNEIQAAKLEVSQDLQHEQNSRLEREEHLQEQADTLAGAIIQGQISQQELEARTNRKIASVEADTKFFNNSQTERGDFLQEQINETSAGIITNAKSIANEAQERRESARHIQEVNSREIEHLQEQSNDLAAGIINLAREIYRQHKHSKSNLQRELALRDSELERMREMIDDLTNAALSLAAMSYHLQTNQSNQKLEARLNQIEYALVEGGLLDPDYMDAMTDAEINALFDSILDNGTAPEDSETTEDDEQINQAIDAILNP